MQRKYPDCLELTFLKSEMTCNTCVSFVRDKCGDGTGIGECQKYNDYKAKTSRKESLMKALATLGHNNDVFWPGDGQECERYEKN